jgi:hypothetical protein
MNVALATEAIYDFAGSSKTIKMLSHSSKNPSGHRSILPSLLMRGDTTLIKA